MTRDQRYYRSHREQTKARVSRWLKNESPEHRELRLKRKRENERKRRIRLASKPRPRLSEEERRARRLESKRKWREKNQPNFDIGRGHGNHAQSLSHMSIEEKRAHRAAMEKKWREEHRDRIKEMNRSYYQKQKENREEWRKLHPKPPRITLTADEKRERKRLYRLRYRDKNYQKCLAREREVHRKHRTRKGEYRPKPSRRIPDYATCPAHARWLMQLATIRKQEASVSFQTAIQSGLTIGQFSS